MKGGGGAAKSPPPPHTHRPSRFDSADFEMAGGAGTRTNAEDAHAAGEEELLPHAGQRMVAQRAVQMEPPGRMRRFDSAEHALSGGTHEDGGGAPGGSGDGPAPLRDDSPAGSVSGPAIVALRAVDGPPNRIRRVDSTEHVLGGGGGGAGPASSASLPAPLTGMTAEENGSRAVAKHALGRLGL